MNIMAQGLTHAGGFSLDFFPSHELELESEGRTKQEKADISARNALRILMMGWRVDWSNLLSLPVISAVFLKRDRALTQGMRLAFQQGFHHIFKQLQNAGINPEQNPLEFEQVQLYLSNCLALLPFGDINPYESIAIPQWINGSWHMIEYSVHPIELTRTSGFKSLFIQDQDRVFAYGLEPIQNTMAQPHLLFMGTTYPAGQGFWSQIKTDLEGFETAGKQLYRNSHEKIRQWLERQSQKAHVCGISLGGSLSLLLAIHQGEHISRVDALNPPGLYSSWHRSRFDLWDDLQEKPLVIVQKNKIDPVSLFGEWKEDWTVIDVTPPEDKEGPNSTAAHAMNYAGLKDTQFQIVDTQLDNEERRTRNFIFYILTRSFVYYCFFVPYFYVALPIFRFISNNIWTILTTIAIALGLTVLAATPASPLILGLIVVLSVCLLPSTIVFAKNCFSGIKALFGLNTPEAAECHHPEVPRNEAMDMYSMDNLMEETFTYQEIAEYYRVKRCTLKNKEFLPAEESPRSKVEFVNTGKRQVLELSTSAEHENDTVTVRATKAKISDIKHTLFFLHKGGDAMQEQLAQQDKLYRVGKI